MIIAASGTPRSYRQPDDAASITGTEDPSRHTPGSRHFRQPDDSWTALFAHGLNYDDGRGTLVPVSAELWQNEDGWEWRSGPLTVAISRNGKGHQVRHLYRTPGGKTNAFSLLLPALTHAPPHAFRFSLAGAEWTLTLGRDRTALGATVAARQGARTYEFEFDTDGLDLSVNAAGHLVVADGTSLSRPLVLRADGWSSQCGPWSIQGRRLSFSCDDSSFPASAFPYLIDPVLSPPVSNLQSCKVCYSGLGGCVSACYPGSFYSENQDDSQGWFHSTASWSMDTSSIPPGATITSAATSMTAFSGYTHYDYAVRSGGLHVGSCSMGQTCSNVPAPVNAIVKGGVTSFTGDCGTCGGWWNWDTGEFGYGAGNLWNFALTVNYSTGPVTTIRTNPPGLTFSVNGVNYTAETTFQWTPGSTYTIAAPTPQPAGAGTQQVWTAWSDGGAASHAITAPSSDAEFVASFAIQHLLTTAANPANGGSIAPPSGWHNAGAVVAVAATPNGDYQFTGFTGALSGSATPQNVTMSGPRSVTANFSVPLVEVTVASAPAGRTLMVDQSACTAPCVFQWLAGSEHTIGVAVSPQSGPAGVRYLFANWSDGAAQSHTITVPAVAWQYIANFTTQYYLTTAVNPSGAGAIAPDSGWHNAGAAVEVSAAAGLDYAFVGFSGGLTGLANPQSLVLNAPAAVTAGFQNARAAIVDPAPATVFPASQVTFTWSAAAGATQYRLEVGTALGSADLSSTLNTGLSRTVTGLPTDGRSVWVRLTTFAYGAWLAPLDYGYQSVTADFSVAAVAPVTVVAGQSAGTTVTVAPTGGFSSTVNFSAAGWPAGLSAGFNPGSVNGSPSWSSALTVTAGANVSPGVYPLSISAVGGFPPLTRTGTVQVTVTALIGITTAAALPGGALGVAYPPLSLAATGGSPPYTWSVASGLLPAPLILSSTGILSGTPKRGGQTFGFEIQVSDSLGALATKNFSLPIGPPVQPISAPSRLEVGLSFMPFDEYDFDHPAGAKFPNSCPQGSSVRSCFQTVLAELRAQGVSGVRIFFGLCGPDSTPLVNCGQPWNNVHYAGSNSTWIRHVKDFFLDAQNAGILNITLTPTHIGGALYMQAKAAASAPGPQVCSDTPDPVYFYATAPLGFKPVISTAGACNPGCTSGYTCEAGICQKIEYHPINGDNQPFDGGYNCSPQNPFFVGWQNQYDVIDAMLSSAAQVAAMQPDSTKRITIFELDFEQELDLLNFPVLARFIVDNAHADSGQPNVRDALRYYMGLDRNGITFDPARVTWSSAWTNTRIPGNQATGAANCPSVYAGFARTMGADQIASAIGQGGAWIGMPGNPEYDPNVGLVCYGDTFGMVGMSSYAATQPSILDVHLRPCVASASGFCALDDANAYVQNEAKIDFDAIANHLARVPGISTVVLGETHSNTQAKNDMQDAEGSDATQTCEGSTLNAAAETVAGYNQSTLAGWNIVFRPWMQLQYPSGNCFSHPSNQRVNFQGAGPYIPSRQ